MSDMMGSSDYKSDELDKKIQIKVKKSTPKPQTEFVMES